MRIAQLAPLAESVPPKGYGGSEQVVSDLTDELIKRGHQVTLFATGDSQSEGATIVACAPQGLRASDIPPTRFPAYDLTALLKLETMQDQFDIIHNHMGYIALPVLRQLRCPSVTTMHNPVKDYCSEIYFACGEQPFIAISNAYKNLNYPDRINYVDTVYNGINIKNFTYDETVQRTNLLFLGRICRDKGTREAIEIARRVNLPLTIAGNIDADGRDYFESEIEPHLNETNIKYIGEVSGQEKSALYTSAIVTLCPINFEEPFGLVLAESIASGTPVMAFARGAVPEVISDGETGILGQTVDDLVGRFPELADIDRSNCRARAEKLFSKERMAENYERVYARLSKGEAVDHCNAIEKSGK